MVVSISQSDLSRDITTPYYHVNNLRNLSFHSTVVKCLIISQNLRDICVLVLQRKSKSILQFYLLVSTIYQELTTLSYLSCSSFDKGLAFIKA